MTSAGPLAGIKVLDLGKFPPTAYCTQMLVQLGAEVCRVDSPGSNPVMFGQGTGLSAGKRSVALDQRHERGGEILRRLAGWADVVVENERPGVMDKRGFGPKVALAENAALIWCSMTGFGQDGPYADWSGHDLSYTAYSGLLEGLNSNLPWHPESMLSVPLGALMAVIGITSALHERNATGSGKHLDISLAESCTWLLTGFEGLLNGAGFRIPASPDRRLYECGDGRFISVAAADKRTWAALCAGLGLDDLAEGMPNPMKPDTWPAAYERLAAVFATKPAAEWVAHLGPTGAAVGPVYAPDELAGDPHAKARHALVDVEGTLVPANPVRVTGDVVTSRTGAPAVGADTRAVLLAAGYAETELDDLVAAGAVAVAE
jgi:alpha-methylacyl-CoA racemase